MLEFGNVSRREFIRSSVYLAAAGSLLSRRADAGETAFELDYILSSCMYGTLPLEQVLEEVSKVGATHIDIWPRVHADHREQMEAMGEEAFRDLLEKHRVRLGMITRYDLGPFKLQEEMKVLSRHGGRILVTGSRGAKKKDSIARDVADFVEELKPHVEAAERHGIVIAIENHGHSLIDSPDSIRSFADAIQSDHLGIALAPYHLPQDPALLARLIEEIGPRLVHFYAWEHGMGCMEKRPKVQEMKQLPGYGDFDFAPVLAALRKIDYRGWTSIFMHPVPRGIPILPTASEVTAAINRSREYLDRCVRDLAPSSPN